MAIKLWSKLESASDVTSPQLGTGGAEVGNPTYVASKFGNGILSDVDSEGCTFPTSDNSININKGTIEVWAKVNFAAIDPDYRFLWTTLQYESGYGGVRLLFDHTLNDFRAVVFVGTAQQAVADTVSLSWLSGDLMHFAVAWDREGNDIGDSKTLVLYVNNVEEASDTATWSTSNINANLYIGIDREGLNHSDMVIDNFKAYDHCKIDFSDRNVESSYGLINAPFFGCNF